MGTVISNLKAKFGVDTSDFKKGLKDGEKAMTEFKDTAKDKVSELAGLFGVNMSAVTGAVGLATKSLGFLKQSFIGARDGSEALAVSTKALKWILASSGIGAVVILLSSLAVYFTKTTQGSKELAAGMAQVKAVGTVLLERLGKYGSGVWDLLKGKFSEGYVKMSTAMYGLADATMEAAERAKELALSNFDLNRREAEFTVVKSAQLVILEEYRLKSRDIELSAKERLASLNEAAKIEKKNNKEELDFLAERLYNAQGALRIDTQNKDKKAELRAAYVLYNEKVAESIIFERTLARQKNTLIKEIRNELAAMKDMNELQAVKTPDMFGNQRKALEQLKSTANQLRGTFIKVKESSSALFEVMGQVAVDASEAMNNAFTSGAEGLGTFLGELMTGKEGIGGFGKLIASTFADLAINVGKIAIGAGMAVLGVKEALMTLNPYVAIAAGVALIAIGTAVKGSLASAASGSGGGGGSTGGLSSSYDTRTAAEKSQNIQLSGKFVVEGKDLVYVITQENTRVRAVNGR